MQKVFNMLFWILLLNTGVAVVDGHFSGLDTLGAVLLTAWTVWSFTSDSGFVRSYLTEDKLSKASVPRAPLKKRNRHWAKDVAPDDQSYDYTDDSGTLQMPENTAPCPQCGDYALFRRSDRGLGCYCGYRSKSRPPAHSTIKPRKRQRSDDALASTVPTLGLTDDIMTRVNATLSHLVPLSCCALFLYDEESDVLRCCFAAGVDAEIVRKVAMPMGHGVTGWVARNRRPLLNARPSADLEAGGLDGATTSLQAALVCPLIISERFIGTLSVYHIVAGCYDDHHCTLLDRFCAQVVAVIYSSIVFEQSTFDQPQTSPGS
jgi:hypothetical protein